MRCPTTEESYLYVDEPAALRELLDGLDDVGRVAMDIEGNGLYRYHQRVCLIQLTAAGRNYIVDPLADVVLDEVLDRLADVTLILHGVDFDLRMMRATFGFFPRKPPIDTMIAGRLLGFEKPGLLPLVEELFGISLSKSGQKSNWTRRPLSDEQIRYAVDDTRYLEPLADELLSRLAILGRTTWAEQSTAAAVAAAGEDAPVDLENAWRIKGVGDLTSAQAAYVRELWAWRERQAQQADLPPFMVLGNAQLINLACWAQRNPKRSLSAGPKLGRGIRGQRWASLQHTIAETHCLDPADYPAPRIRRGRRRPDPGPKFKALRDAVGALADELSLPASTVVPRAALEALSNQPTADPDTIADVTGLLPWQVELLSPLAEQVYSSDAADEATN